MNPNTQQQQKFGIAASAVVGVTDDTVQLAVHNGQRMKLIEIHKNGKTWDAMYQAPPPQKLGRGFFITRHQKHQIELAHAHGWRVCGTQNGPAAPTFAWDESVNSGFTEKEFKL